jgi:hypothetical protein
MFSGLNKYKKNTTETKKNRKQICSQSKTKNKNKSSLYKRSCIKYLDGNILSNWNSLNFAVAIIKFSKWKPK